MVALASVIVSNNLHPEQVPVKNYLKIIFGPGVRRAHHPDPFGGSLLIDFGILPEFLKVGQ